MPSPMIGEIRLFAFGRAPRGWLLCDGSTPRITDYERLFFVINTSYGGDGAETFGLPDMRGRVPVHQGQGISKGVNLSNRYLGAKGGSETVTLQVNHIPAHTHAFQVSSDQADSLQPEGKLLGAPVGDNMYVAPDKIGAAVSGSTADTTTTVVGGSKAHENTMPTLALSYCICADGNFPSRDGYDRSIANMAFIGEIQIFGFGYAPPGWMRCDGRELAINKFVELYSLSDITYGGDGKIKFRIPNLTGR